MLKSAQRTTLTDLFAAQLTSVAGFRVVPREQIRRLLQASKNESYRGCVDEACQIQLGKALAAEKVIRAKTVREERQCLSTATLYDLRTEASERAAVTRGECTAMGLSRAMEALARSLR
jgi:hypothetical protein